MSQTHCTVSAYTFCTHSYQIFPLSFLFLLFRFVQFMLESHCFVGCGTLPVVSFRSSLNLMTWLNMTHRRVMTLRRGNKPS
ncbi:hypothetical protein K439DRAFT_63594 [Ramaria rubella]|nr:hypothetical protein K439DRAFT_63594 [Ramaria rubella]